MLLFLSNDWGHLSKANPTYRLANVGQDLYDEKKWTNVAGRGNVSQSGSDQLCSA